MKKNNTYKGLALASIVVASALSGGIATHLLTQPQIQEVAVEKLVEVEKIVEVETIKEVPVNVTVEKVVEVEDTAFLKLVCDRAMFDDLMDCKKEITAEDKALSLAIDELKKDFAREAYRAGLVQDDRRAELVRVYDDFDKITVVRSDFDRSRYEFVIEARLDDLRADERLDAEFTIKVDNGVARIVDVE